MFSNKQGEQRTKRNMVFVHKKKGTLNLYALIWKHKWVGNISKIKDKQKIVFSITCRKLTTSSFHFNKMWTKFCRQSKLKRETDKGAKYINSLQLYTVHLVDHLFKLQTRQTKMVYVRTNNYFVTKCKQWAPKVKCFCLNFRENTLDKYK